MTYTIQSVVEAIAGKLSDLNYPIYASAVQQDVDLPCFFISLMPSTSESQVDERNLTTLFVDVVFLQRPDIPDATDLIFSVIQHLNEKLEFITLTDGEGSTAEEAPIHTYDRQYHLENMDLHYQFNLKLRGHLPKDVNLLKALEEINYEIKE